MPGIEGMGPDVETKYNEKGAAQSNLKYRFDLIDGPALFEMAHVLHEGAEKYGADNWRGIEVRDHLNHLIAHAYAYLSGDESDEHLSHIMCRAMFAQAVAKQEEKQPPESSGSFLAIPIQQTAQIRAEINADADAMEALRQTTPYESLGPFGTVSNPRYAAHNGSHYELTINGWRMITAFDKGDTVGTDRTSYTESNTSS